MFQAFGYLGSSAKNEISANNGEKKNGGGGGGLGKGAKVFSLRPSNPRFFTRRSPTKGPFTQAIFVTLSNATFVSLELTMKIANVH